VSDQKSYIEGLHSHEKVLNISLVAWLHLFNILIAATKHGPTPNYFYE
jgi:hypothetical protein